MFIHNKDTLFTCNFLLFCLIKRKQNKSKYHPLNFMMDENCTEEVHQETNIAQERKKNEGEDSNIASDEYKNRYAVYQTLATSTLDLGLLSGNANQLKYIIRLGNKDDILHKTNLVLICISIILQVIMGILITINYFNLQLPEKKIKATRINIAISVFAIVITVINIIVTSFEPDDINESYNV